MHSRECVDQDLRPLRRINIFVSVHSKANRENRFSTEEKRNRGIVFVSHPERVLFPDSRPHARGGVTDAEKRVYLPTYLPGYGRSRRYRGYHRRIPCSVTTAVTVIGRLRRVRQSPVYVRAACTTHPRHSRHSRREGQQYAQFFRRNGRCL